jgi:hypothetical protein
LSPATWRRRCRRHPPLATIACSGDRRVMWSDAFTYGSSRQRVHWPKTIQAIMDIRVSPRWRSLRNECAGFRANTELAANRESNIAISIRLLEEFARPRPRTCSASNLSAQKQSDRILRSRGRDSTFGRIFVNSVGQIFGKP